MRAAVECCDKGWGEPVIIGVAGAGEEISTRPFQLVTGRVWRGSAFGGVRGRSELPGYVERAQRGEITLDTFITHTMGLTDINRAFDLMAAGQSIRSVILFRAAGSRLPARGEGGLSAASVLPAGCGAGFGSPDCRRSRRSAQGQPVGKGRRLTDARCLAGDQIPDGRAADAEALAARRDANAAVIVDETVAGDAIEKPLPFLPR